MINPSTREGYHRFAPMPNRRSRRDRAEGMHRADAAEPSLFGWFAARSDLAAKLGLLACVLFYGLTAAYGVVAGGHWDHVRQTIASATNGAAISAGFEVKAVQVEGRRNIRETEIAEALGSHEGLSIFAFDTAAARERLKANGWIEEARVMRLLPSALIVELEERKPYALWREGGKIAGIDAEGRALALTSPAEFPDLPIVSGPGAASPAKEIIEALAVLPELRTRIQDIERIAGRRWDIVLDTGLRAKLPRDGFTEALADLSLIAQKNPAAFYEIAEMDFRVPLQFTIRLKDESEKGRRQFLSWLTASEASSSQGL
jgi:cell division protein FtsQ